MADHMTIHQLPYEATANVDPENETELTATIEALTKEKTIIMIAHRLKTVRRALRQLRP